MFQVDARVDDGHGDFLCQWTQTVPELLPSDQRQVGLIAEARIIRNCERPEQVVGGGVDDVSTVGEGCGHVARVRRSVVGETIDLAEWSGGFSEGCEGGEYRLDSPDVKSCSQAVGKRHSRFCGTLPESYKNLPGGVLERRGSSLGAQ